MRNIQQTAALMINPALAGNSPLTRNTTALAASSSGSYIDAEQDGYQPVPEQKPKASKPDNTPLYIGGAVAVVGGLALAWYVWG